MRTLSVPMRRVVVGSWVVILVLSVATLTLYVDNKRTKECLATYMVKDNIATKERIVLADKEREAFKGTLQTLVTEPDPIKRLNAINTYVLLLNKNDQTRKENPVPTVPTECD